MRHLILGAGEIGQAYHSLFKSAGEESYRVDLLPERTDKKLPKEVDVLHVCLRYGPDFGGIVRKTIERFWPQIVNVMSTVPPGTTETIDPSACHSTTRGLHPNLSSAIQVTAKHIGGPKAQELADAFGNICHVPAILHDHAKTTEALHLASNFTYAAELLAADEVDAMLRTWGVDYLDFLSYQSSHNAGYKALGLHSKMRAVVYPPHGHLGGHCIKLPAEFYPKEKHGPIMRRLADYA